MRQSRPGVAVWAVVSSALAPLALVGGWLVAQTRQPHGYDPVRDTISALARHGATDRWVMTTGLALLGLAHVVTATGLRALRPASRIVLAAAGVATAGVAVFAEPDHGSSSAHAGFAGAAFVLLALWPATTATTASGSHGAPHVLRPAAAIGMSAVSLGLLGWFAVTLSMAGAGTGLVGLSERVLSAQQALWPLAVVVGLRRSP